MGGTGKTQIALHLAARTGTGLSIVSRGHGGSLEGPFQVSAETPASAAGDEAVLLARRLSSVGVKVIVSRDRAAGIELAKTLGCTRVLLDDGLQQMSVEPTRRVVVFGAEAPLGNGSLLPLGPLREPLSVLREADLVWLHGEGGGKGLPRVDVRSRTKPLGLQSLGSPDAPLLPLPGRRVMAFAGIARPGRFVDTLRQGGAEVVGFVPFADHRGFTAEDLDHLGRRAREAGADALVCTEKDGVRLLQTDLPLYALRTELEVTAGMERVRKVLAQL